MPQIEKLCPIILRAHPGGAQVLAFAHPLGGHQLVKGTRAPGEPTRTGALRELYEESGLAPPSLTPLGPLRAAPMGQLWHLFALWATGLPESWRHQTLDDHGHVFSFFWHPLAQPLGPEWDHAAFHQVFALLRSRSLAHIAAWHRAH